MWLTAQAVTEDSQITDGKIRRYCIFFILQFDIPGLERSLKFDIIMRSICLLRTVIYHRIPVFAINRNRDQITLVNIRNKASLIRSVFVEIHLYGLNGRELL